MKILLTGCSGFLAQHVMPLLMNEGHEVIGVDKRPLQGWQPNKFIQTDVFDLGFKDMMGIDAVIHFAFVTNIPNSVRHPRETTYQNIDMTIHLVELAKEAQVKKFIFPSTASLYSSNAVPWKEDMPPLPIEPYSWQKLACEYACKMYSNVYGVNTAILRFFQVFGEYQREDTALSAFIKNKKEGKPITLTGATAQSSFKSGRRDFIYAGDVAEAVIKAVEDDSIGNGEIYNVCSGKVRTMEEIANALEAKVQWIPKRGYEVDCHWGDNSKLISKGWSPKVDIIEWIKQFA